MNHKKSQTTKAVMTTMLLMATAMMIVPSASATDANCGDPALNPTGYVLCRYSDVLGHCHNDYGKPCAFVDEVTDVVWEVSAEIYEDGTEAVIKIAGSGFEFAFRVACGGMVMHCDIEQKYALNP